MDTTGILLITNDGDLAYRLTHPRYKVEKRYSVTVEGRVSDDTAASVASGVDLGDYVTSPCYIRILDRDVDSSTLEITLKEGKKRQIRRMFAESGHPVRKLGRTALAGLEFSDLEKGGIRSLTEAEEARLREMTGLK
jgi:pseudouridine synthase